MNLSVLKASFRKCPRCRSVVNCAPAAADFLSVASAMQRRNASRIMYSCIVCCVHFLVSYNLFLFLL